MPDALQRATTGRARCRGCERPIAKGELRFGEASPSAYAEGETLHWFHLTCAACMRGGKLLALLASASDDVPERDWLESTAREGVEHPRLEHLARAERAPSARARCRECHDAIDKGAWRLALQVFEDGRANPSGSVHVACAERHFGTRDVLERVRRLMPDLSDADADARELERALSEPARAAAPADALAKTRGDADANDAAEDSPARAPGERSAS